MDYFLRQPSACVCRHMKYGTFFGIKKDDKVPQVEALGGEKKNLRHMNTDHIG